MNRTDRADEMTEVTAPLGRGGRTTGNKKAAPKGGLIDCWRMNLDAGPRFTPLP
jgi:hypothetical protein